MDWQWGRKQRHITGKTLHQSNWKMRTKADYGDEKNKWETPWRDVLRNLIVRNRYWQRWRKDSRLVPRFLPWVVTVFIEAVQRTVAGRGRWWIQVAVRWVWEAWESSEGRMCRGFATWAWSSIRRSSAVGLLIPLIWVEFGIFRRRRKILCAQKH